MQMSHSSPKHWLTGLGRIAAGHFFHTLLAVSIFSACAVAADTYPRRISLAFSGGASMGAYEAGLIWGATEVLRQVQNTRDWPMGGEQRPLEISSIAGTSAGGINTLLAALVWPLKPESQGGFPNRIGQNIFRDVWLTPDVNQLMPPSADSPIFLPGDALLSRKELVAAARELRRKWSQPGTFRPGLRLPLGVTVTRVEPETISAGGVDVGNQRFFIPFELRTREDGSAEFYFDPGDYPPLDDPAMILMPWPKGGKPFSVSDQQIEDALLTTSAFPGGFGRKRLLYCRQQQPAVSQSRNAAPAMPSVAVIAAELTCPEGYEPAEAEFADGGLFDNLPVGLARLLAESGDAHEQMPLPIRYMYLDPNRERYEIRKPDSLTACQSDTPPEACRTMTFDLASELAVLGGAIGTARKYELYRELTSDNWKLNLPQLSRQVADMLDAGGQNVACGASLSFVDGPVTCSDRLRSAARLLEISQFYHVTPIPAALSPQALLREEIASECRAPSARTKALFSAECAIDSQRLRRKLTDAAVELSKKVTPAKPLLTKDIQRSGLSVDSDRSMLVTIRGGPITGLLLDAFGAFLDYKFREYDYHVGIYDAIVMISSNQCASHSPVQDWNEEIIACFDSLSEQLYRGLGVEQDPKGRYEFALLARQEFGPRGALRFACDPMPPEDRDTRIIFEGLNKSILRDETRTAAGTLHSTERAFFDYLRAEGFEPTPVPGSAKPLLSQIIENPEYWLHEMVKRTTDRLIYLEQQAEAVYQAREPDPDKQEEANTGLMGAGALVLRNATYKYPGFTFSPSTAPERWQPWRNLIPYEAAFDFVDGDLSAFWQPTWTLRHTNIGLRFGFGFAGGVLDSRNDQRGNYGVLGVDLSQGVDLGIISGFGITPALYHYWEDPVEDEQTSLGLDLHVNILKNRVRVSLGARDIVNDAGETFFMSLGITDLPGIIYWMSR